MYAIEIKDLSYYYGDVCALENIDLTINEKDFLGIIGPNGGGKTTLMKLMLGFLKPQTGNITVHSTKALGYVPQMTSFDKNFPIKVLDVVLMGKLEGKSKWFHGYTEAEKTEAMAILEQLHIAHLASRQIGQLSGGQLQKVLIARALITNPEILLLDEPTASLDKASTQDIFQTLKRLNKEKTIIIVSHDMEELFAYVQSVASINRTLHYHREDLTEHKGRVKRPYNCPIELLLNSYNKYKVKGHLEGQQND